MEVIQQISNVHEDKLAGVAYNHVKKQLYTCAEGDMAIKVRRRREQGCCHQACSQHPAPAPPNAQSHKAWDLKTGELLRVQTVHRGMVTSLAYAPGVKLLFSGSIDGSIAAWTDKGVLLQVRCPVGTAVALV
jgi:hypothetical protein